ncbi:MAG: SLC13 family permease [Ruminococcus sp.]
MQKIINFFKKETVLSIALLAAVASVFFIHPDKEYFSYIDYRTICILFSLMAVMEGFNSIGIFSMTARKLLSRAKSIRSVITILVCLCFFFSMLITNDVALITFVPLTIVIFRMLGNELSAKLLIPTVVMQTIAANLGSMLTPIGNPQNLYLYGISGIGPGDFILLTLPFAATAFILLMIWIAMKTHGIVSEVSAGIPDDNTSVRKNPLIMYTILFVVCLLAVAKLLHFLAVTLIVLTAVLLTDRKILKRIDYALLLTFAGFFIFIGNMGRIEAINSFIGRIIESNEFAAAVAASQIISNVPCALLLSGFSENYSRLILGTNIGGLGTLIASMASLISFKYIVNENQKLRKNFFLSFTLANIIFLAAMLLLYAIINL